ncbi:MAG: hypothetical protein FWH22_08360 [Fibromonadales bacterium]|nr:hypothetical protein [Fibromonadales bacterium]
METLLIFFAIIAIQVVASYFKQKKEAEKKRNSPPPKPRQRPIPQEAAPLPDPFREIREMMGLPPVEEPEELQPVLQYEEHEPDPKPKSLELELEFKREGLAPKNLPFQSAADRSLRTKNNEHSYENVSQAGKETCKLKIHNAVDINNLRQGILWTAILQQPRFRSKWKRR